MTIDENKIKTPFHITPTGPIYTDHCAIMTKMDWYTANKLKENEKINITRDLQHFKEKTNKKILTNIAKSKDDIISKYGRWQNEVNEIFSICFKNKNRKRKNRKILKF